MTVQNIESISITDVTAPISLKLAEHKLRRFFRLPESRRLAAFIAVAEELHFRKAANRLGIEQSPLSRLIKGFEDDIGVQLFVRTRRSVRLTVAGARLVSHATVILMAVDDAIGSNLTA